MGVHLPAGAMGIMAGIRIGIQLGKELFYRGCTRSKGKGLIAIVASVKVPRPEKLSHRHLRNFLSIAENAEFCLPGQDFLPAQETGFPAFAGRLVIFQYCIPEIIEGQFFRIQDLV